MGKGLHFESEHISRIFLDKSPPLSNTRKLDCPTEIQIRCVKVFVDYGVDLERCATVNSLTMAKRSILKQLVKKKCNQSKGESLRTMTRFYVKIPLSAIHLYHPLGAAATIGQYLDKRILEKVFELVQKSITNLGEVKRCLDQFVERELFCDVPDLKKVGGRRTDDIIPVVKTFAITLQKQFQHRSTRTTTKSLSTTRLRIGANSLPNRSTFTDHETIHRTKELKPISQKRIISFLSSSEEKEIGKEI